MTSSEKEAFDFRQVVPIEGAVETWMTAVEAEMRKTLYQITKEGVFYYAKSPRCVQLGFGHHWCSLQLQLVQHGLGAEQQWRAMHAGGVSVCAYMAFVG